MIPLQEELYEYRYWILGIALSFTSGMFALIRGFWLLRKRKSELNESKRELDFQKFAFDEHAIISVADVKGNITKVNDKFCEISGYSREELLGQNHRMLKSDEHSGEFHKDMWRTIAKGKPWHGEIKNLKKDGGYYWVEATIVPFLSKQGKPIEYVGLRTDITARKDAEKEKSENAAQEIRQFKTTLDLTENEVYMFWPDTLKFFYVNQAAKNKFGWNNEEFLNMTPLDIRPEFGESEYRDMFKPLIQGKQKSFTFETVHQTRNGEMIPVEANVQYLKPSGEKPRFVAIVKDITERQKVDKAKSEFLSTVSHELRTPLTAIKGVLSLIEIGAFDESPDELHSMINIAKVNSDRLVVLINDILDMEKLEAGKMSFQMEATDITQLIEEALVGFKSYGDEYGVTFTCPSTDDPLFVNGDKNRLMQVLANLLSNAVKFSPRGGKVKVSVSRHNEHIRIAVKDYGCGIPEEARATIFDRFTQADSSEKRAKGGTGLGLNITKTIVEGHGGTISFTSEMGKGTTFYIDLPEVKTKSLQQTFETEK